MKGIGYFKKGNQLVKLKYNILGIRTTENDNIISSAENCVNDPRTNKFKKIKKETFSWKLSKNYSK